VTETNGSPAGVWVPETDAERAAIREQLERILTSHLFRNSKRYPNLLRFAVDHVLEGHTEHLKERTLGVAVFGRTPNYDTNLDPVVRTTAVEIRKRIAQYYHEPGHETEIRIEFPPGTYFPEFSLPPKTGPVSLPIAPKRRWGVLIAATVTVALLTGAVAWRPWTSGKALDRFWRPVLDSPEPALLYIGGRAPDNVPNPPVTVSDLQRAEKVAFADATALANVTALLVSKRKPYHIRLQTLGKLEELKDGPAVLIGAFNNSWTLRATRELRFRFERNPDEPGQTWIRDTRNPGSRNWLMPVSSPYASVSEDYAIVSRVWDQTTGKIVVTAAGLSKFGTAAAGEFLADPEYMEVAARGAPRDWDRKNIQIVIATHIVGQSSGPPRVVAAQFW
jgi:hypothetical protein